MSLLLVILFPVVAAQYDGYVLQTSGVSCGTVPQSECNTAANILELDGSFVESVTYGNKPPGCIYSFGRKWNTRSDSTAQCSTFNMCLCKVSGPLCGSGLTTAGCICMQDGATAGAVCEANNVCTNGVCQPPPACSSQDGGQANLGECTCGDEICTSSELFCDTSKDPSCGVEPLLQQCSSTDGSQENVPCICGSTECTTETGLYCDASKASCSKISGPHILQSGTYGTANCDVHIPTASECLETANMLGTGQFYSSISEIDNDYLPRRCIVTDDGLRFNTAPFPAANTVPEPDCDAGISTHCICRTLLAPVCTETGSTQNPAPCFCGTDPCYTASFCVDDQCSDIPPSCVEDQRALNGQCVDCEPGRVSTSYPNPAYGDTECDAVLCLGNRHVVNHECVQCPPGKTNVMGDSAADGDTECDLVLCAQGEKVVNHVCTACPAGRTTLGGDDASGQDTSCHDIDECVGVVCHGNCTNGDNQYQCTCDEGWEVDGPNKVCTNVNECLDSPCDVNANCVDTAGSYTCACKSGFVGNGLVCEDVNECLSDPCPARAVCVNTLGSHTCVCESGFEGETCEDVNECLSDPCPSNANCTNTVGSFECTCRAGFSKFKSVCRPDAKSETQFLNEVKGNLVAEARSKAVRAQFRPVRVPGKTEAEMMVTLPVEKTDVAESVKALVEAMESKLGAVELEMSIAAPLTDVSSATVADCHLDLADQEAGKKTVVHPYDVGNYVFMCDSTSGSNTFVAKVKELSSGSEVTCWDGSAWSSTVTTVNAGDSTKCGEVPILIGSMTAGCGGGSGCCSDDECVHGTCESNVCSCDEGFEGETCATPTQCEDIVEAMAYQKKGCCEC